MKPDRSLPFLRILAKVLGLVGHRAPLALASFSITSIGLSAATLMVYHQVEQLISLLNKSESISELVGRIVVLGVVLMILVLIGIVQDPLALYFRQTGIRVAMEAMHEKIERLELIDFETLDANERIDLAKSGIEGALTMLMTFLFPASS